MIIIICTILAICILYAGKLINKKNTIAHEKFIQDLEGQSQKKQAEETRIKEEIEQLLGNNKQVSISERERLIRECQIREQSKHLEENSVQIIDVLTKKYTTPSQDDIIDIIAKYRNSLTIFETNSNKYQGEYEDKIRHKLWLEEQERQEAIKREIETNDIERQQSLETIDRLTKKYTTPSQDDTIDIIEKYRNSLTIFETNSNKYQGEYEDKIRHKLWLEEQERQEANEKHHQEQGCQAKLERNRKIADENNRKEIYINLCNCVTNFDYTYN